MDKYGFPYREANLKSLLIYCIISPPADNFYDLFAGGCATTLLSKRKKYNDTVFPKQLGSLKKKNAIRRFFIKRHNLRWSFGNNGHLFSNSNTKLLYHKQEWNLRKRQKWTI